MFNAECVTCTLLGACNETSPDKILNHYVCHRYLEVNNQETVQARCDVINKFGKFALEALINPDTVHKGEG
jgi:hypothetical protein